MGIESSAMASVWVFDFTKFAMYRWVVAQSVFYHLYNQVSYMSLDEISPLTFSIGNTIKRVTVIVSSIIIFRTKLLPINVVGAAIAILGTFLYSQVSKYLCPGTLCKTIIVVLVLLHRFVIADAQIGLV